MRGTNSWRQRMNRKAAKLSVSSVIQSPVSWMRYSAGTRYHADARFRCGPGLSWFVGIVIQIRRKPSFHHAQVHVLAEMVVEHLVAVNLAHPEVFRLRMRKIKAADGTGGPHRVTFRQLDGRIPFYVEQLPKNPFLRVVRARGITRRGTDSPVFLA